MALIDNLPEVVDAGNNVQRIEVKHVTTPEEAMALIDNLVARSR